MLKKVIIILLISITAFCDEDTSRMVREQLHALAPLKIHGGNVELMGENQLAKLELAQWFKTMLKRTETFFGSQIDFDNHIIRLVIGAESSGKQFITTSIFEGKVLQRLVIPNVDDFDLQHLEKLLSEIFLRGYVYDTMDKKILLNTYQDIKLPDWLSIGLSRSLYNQYKQDDAENAYMDWINGKVLSLKIIFDDNLWSTNIASVFLNRLKKEPGYRKKFTKLFEEIGKATFVGYYWIQDEILDIDDETYVIFWDDCLYIQKYMFYVARTDMNDFGKYLLQQSLYSFKGYSGIPNVEHLPLAMSPIMVIKFRDDDWVGKYIESKPRELQVLAVGKSDQYREIAEQVCNYIQSIRTEENVKDFIINYRKIQTMVDGELAKPAE